MAVKMTVKFVDKTFYLVLPENDKYCGAAVSICGTDALDGVKSVTIWKEGSGRGEVAICDGRSPSQMRRPPLDEAYRTALKTKDIEAAGFILLEGFFSPDNQWPDGFREQVSKTLDYIPAAA